MSVSHWLDGLRFQFSPTGRRISRKRRLARLESAQIASEALENRLLLTTTYINAGGSELAGDPSFSSDAAFENGAGRTFGTRATIDTSQVDSSIPEEVFQSVRWDPLRGPDMQFDIPANSGSDYKVDLLFSEIYRGGFDVGRRVFDVNLEGSTVLDNFDIFQEAGANTGIVRSFEFTATDDNIDIDFSRVRRRPTIAGIIVTELTDGGDDGGGGGTTNTPPTISNVPNQTINENDTLGPLNFTVNDVDGDTVTVTATSSNPALVSPSGITTTGTGDNRTVSVTPTADASGVTTVTLTASDGTASATDQFIVTVNDATDPVDPPVDPPAGPQVVSLNAGGGSVGEFTAASSFHDRARTRAARRPAAISNVPANLPQAVFQSHVWSPRRLGDLQFDIPNESGVEYQVDLLFAETWRAAFQTTRRVFDVDIDGQQVLTNLDVFARVGANAALVETFTITGDGNLDIDLSHVRNNPMISGVVVTRLGDPAPVENRAPVLNAIADRGATTDSLIAFTASATDPDGDTLTYSILTQGLPGTPTISPQLGQFSWTPPTAGTFNVTLLASDGQLTDTESFQVNVTDASPVNQPPVIGVIPTQQVTVGTQLSFTVSATDSDAGDSISYSLNASAPTGAAINQSSGVVTWTPTATQIGTASFPVFASDGTDSVSRTATVVVVAAPVNNAPVLAPIGNQIVEAGEQLTFTATATDADAGSNLQFSLGPGAPAGATINASTGVFNWTPDPFQSGPVSITVEVTDGVDTDSETFTVNVVTGQAPTIAAIADRSVQAGTLLEFTITATDPNPNDTQTWTLVSTDLPGAPQIGSSTGLFSWTPPVSDGPGFQVTVRVTDSTGLSDTESFTVNVTPATGNNTPPVLASIPAQTATVGQQFTLAASATDADNDTLSYFLDPTAPTGATINSVNGIFTWTPATAGTFTFPIFVSDGVDSVSQTATITVTGQGPGGNNSPVIADIPNQSANAGSQLTFTVTATDADNDPLEFFLDPTAPNGASINAATGVFTWTPSPNDAGPVSFPIFVTDGTATVSRNVSIVVDDGPGGGGGGGTNVAPSFGPQNDLTVAATSTLTATFTADDPDAGDTLTYTLVTQNLPGNPSINAQSGVFTWTPPASAAEMEFQVIIRATDLAGASDDALVSINVLDSGPGGGGGGGGSANQPPVVEAIPDQTATVGTALSFMVNATDPDGDALEYFLDPTGPFSATLTTAGVFTWTPTAADIGTTTFPIFVFDGTANVFENVTIVVSA